MNEITFIKARLPDPRTRSSKEVRRCIREIWDAVGPTGFRIYPKRFEGPMTYHCNVCLIKKTVGGTARLDQILDMSQEEFYDEVGYPVGWR